MKKTNAADRQRAVYLAGAAGITPGIPLDPVELERRAGEQMNHKAFAYVAGGAGLERTMTANRNGFDKWQIIPRMMRNVDIRDTSTTLFGHQIPAPFFLAPVGVLEMAHRDADLAVAKASAACGIPFAFSNQASTPMELCGAAMGSVPHFFQLYWSRSDELVVSLLQRAESCGCTAIVLTLDTTMLGWRLRDLDRGSLPFLRGMGIAQYTSDPVFQRLLDAPDHTPRPKTPVTLAAIGTLIAATRRHPGNFWKNLFSGRGLKAVRKFIQIYSRPNITWADLPFLREHTRLPIILKGILHPDDAKKALDYGVDGIYVSNHGGRQVDGSAGAIEMLPRVVEAVRGKAPVLFDSGVRGGADAFKAIALGASAVGIGRPYCYALALGGQAGVEELLENWMADFELTMALSGCKNLDDIRKEGVVQKA